MVLEDISFGANEINIPPFEIETNSEINMSNTAPLKNEETSVSLPDSTVIFINGEPLRVEFKHSNDYEAIYGNNLSIIIIIP